MIEYNFSPRLELCYSEIDNPKKVKSFVKKNQTNSLHQECRILYATIYVKGGLLTASPVRIK